MKPLPICTAYTLVFLASLMLWLGFIAMILLLPWPWFVALGGIGFVFGAVLIKSNL